MVYKISKKSLFKKRNQDIYDIQISNLTYKGLSDSTIQLNYNISNISQKSDLVLEAIGGIEPYVRPVLSINNQTSQLLNFSDGFLDIDSTYVYHFILMGYLNSDNDDDTIGLVRYSVNNGKLESPNILNYGSTVNYDTAVYNNDLYRYKQDHDNELQENFVEQDIGFHPGTTLIGTNVIDAEVISGGSGYTLGSTFYIDQPYGVSDYVSNKCTLNCKFSLSSNTIVITGGSGYLQNDTFSVSSNEDDGEILVTEVDNNGAIISTQVSSPGLGFNATPTVTYNGATGSSASITINDDYSVSFNKADYDYMNYLDEFNAEEDYPHSIPLDNPYSILVSSGEAYTTNNYNIKAKNSLNEEYTPDAYGEVYITSEDIDSSAVIIFAADNYDITNIYVESSGNNLSVDNIKLFLVDKDDDNPLVNLTQSDYITINDTLIDINKPLDLNTTITDYFRVGHSQSEE